MTEKKSYT